MKKIITLLLMGITTFGLLSCSDKEEYCTKSMHLCYVLSYTSNFPLEENNVYEQFSNEEFYDLVDSKEDILVYYGQPECTFCVNNVGAFDKVAKELGISKIYYLPAHVLTRKDKDKANVDTMTAKYGFDEKSTPDKMPQLWRFKDGAFNDTMRKYTEASSLSEAAKKLMENYIVKGE